MLTSDKAICEMNTGELAIYPLPYDCALKGYRGLILSIEFLGKLFLGKLYSKNNRLFSVCQC